LLLEIKRDYFFIISGIQVRPTEVNTRRGCLMVGSCQVIFLKVASFSSQLGTGEEHHVSRTISLLGDPKNWAQMPM
jgi:hypothetical protein